MNRARLPFVLLVAGGLLVPAAASSQTGAGEPLANAVVSPPAAAATAPAAEQLGPSARTAALLGARQAHDPIEDAAPRQEIEIDDGDDGGVPYMIAGSVLFIAGAIAGGDAGTILMLGGAAAGAYGAFVYFGGD